MSINNYNTKAENVKARKILEDFNSSFQGLSNDEVEKRRAEFGLNEATEIKKNSFINFLSYFMGPIPFMIEIAALLSIFAVRYVDFTIIFILLVLNAIVKFWNDKNSSKTINLLKQKLQPSINVLRDDKWINIPSKKLVPGDIIKLKPGNIVPADILLIKGDFIECDNSLYSNDFNLKQYKILGELFPGTVIKKGEMTAVVKKIGTKTNQKNDNQLDKKSKSSFERSVTKIGNYLIMLAVFLVVLILVVAMFRHDDLIETLRFVLILTVSSIPVALPVVLSITLALGAISLSKKKIILNKLSAIEDLAGIDTIMCDISKSFTENNITVGEPFSLNNFSRNEIIFYSALASRKNDNEDIDDAILNKAYSIDSVKQKLDSFEIKNFNVFNSEIKRTEVIAANNKEEVTVIKGAPYIIFDLVKSINGYKIDYDKKVEDFAKMGYNVIAVAKKSAGKNWQLVGIIPLFNPIKENIADAIREANLLGIDVKVVTGDNQSITKHVFQKIGFKTNTLPADKLINYPSHLIEELVEKAGGISEVSPDQKFSVMKLMQKLKHYIGITGHRIEDAVILKKANCGISFTDAPDIVKSSASVVLALPGIENIINAVKDSRIIFQRISSYSIYRIAETIRVLLFITLSILFFNFYPVTAVMIVFLILLNDAPIITIAKDNVKYSEKPERWNTKTILSIGTFLGLIGVVSSFLFFYIGKDILHLGTDTLQAFIFLNLVIAGHFTIFLSRTKGPFWSVKPSSKLFWSAVITKIVATFFAVYGWFISPIGWNLALIVWAYAIVTFVITDLLKVYFYNVMLLKKV